MKNIELVDSRVSFNEALHTYHLGEKQLNGITGLIKKHIFPDLYKDIPEFILNRAAERGSIIHKDCYTYDVFQSIESEEVGWYADLLKENGLDVITSEYIVTDFEHFASPIDKVIVKNNLLYLADVKCTYKLNEEYVAWQLSIYKHLFEKQNPFLKITGLYAIHIKDGARLVEIDAIDDDVISQLLQAEKNGEIFNNPFAPVVKTDESDTALALIQKLTAIIADIEDLKELEKSYKESIEKLFTNSGVDKWETDQFIITKTKDYEKTSLDSTKLKKEQPEIFEQYSRTSTVNGSIRSKLK